MSQAKREATPHQETRVLNATPNDYEATAPTQAIFGLNDVDDSATSNRIPRDPHAFKSLPGFIHEEERPECRSYHRIASPTFLERILLTRDISRTNSNYA